MLWNGWLLESGWLSLHAWFGGNHFCRRIHSLGQVCETCSVQRSSEGGISLAGRVCLEHCRGCTMVRAQDSCCTLVLYQEAIAGTAEVLDQAFNCSCGDGRLLNTPGSCSACSQTESRRGSGAVRIFHCVLAM
eukprot:6463361-Amphidinium_carterae.2